MSRPRKCSLTAIFAAGASTPEELGSICADMQTIAQDETTLVMLARVTQVWARL